MRASAFGDRKNLNRLIDGIIDGKIKKVYCTYLDRVSRIPALTALIQHLCDRFNVEIVVLEVEENDPSEMELFIQEVLAYFTVLCNKISGKKGGQITKVVLSPEAIARITELYDSGLNAYKITAVMAAEEYTDNHGNPVSYRSVRNIIANKPIREIVKIKKEKDRPITKEQERKIILEWFEKRVHLTGDDNQTVPIIDFFFAFEQWARTKKRLSYIPTQNMVTVTINREGGEKADRMNAKAYKSSNRGGKIYRGVVIK